MEEYRQVGVVAEAIAQKIRFHWLFATREFAWGFDKQPFQECGPFESAQGSNIWSW